MRTRTLLTVSVALGSLLAARPLWAGWEGVLKVGGIALDEEGDRSAVQEMYNIHDGFSISQIRIAGQPSPDHYVMLNLREINLEGRRGDFLFRRPGLYRITASYDENQQYFDRRGSINSERKDFKVDARVTPVKWLKLYGSLNTNNRDGNRLGYPPSQGQVLGTDTQSALGTSYNYAMNTWRFSAEARKDRRGAALDYRLTDFTDDLNLGTDRTGNVVSARLWTSTPFYRKLTHYLRASYGQSKLSETGLDYTLSSFQYTGMARPVSDIEFKYNFDAQRVDHEGTDVKTDRFQHNLDAIFYYQGGNVSGGYSYEMNDDDDHLTSYNTWRVGAVLRGDRHTARIRYAGREKTDTEQLTLLQDVEASRLLADLDVEPAKNLKLDFGFNERAREFPDIAVKSRGRVLRGGIGYTYPGWGGISSTYSYTVDEYTDRAAGYDVNSHVVTARADLDRIPNTRLSGGVTYMDLGKDLNIEKSIVFLEAGYTVAKNYHFEVKYNVYNYDDYVLLDRYYTANVVWFNVAYDIHVE